MTAPNINNVSGLSPISRVDGAKWGNSLRLYYVPSTNTNALYVGDPVVKVTGSANGNGINGVDLATAGANAVVTGVVCGFAGVATAGSTNTPAFYGLSGTPGAVYRPASTSQDYYVLVNDDPEALFTVQVTSNAVMSVGDVGKNFNLVAGAGSTYTGLSGFTISNTEVVGDALGQVNVIGFDQTTRNDPTLPYANVLVRLNTSTETNRSTGI